MLHRSVDMSSDVSGVVQVANAELPVAVPVMSLVDREHSAQEWAQQEPLGPEGWDRFDSETSMQSAEMQIAEARERAAEATAREVTQAVSVAAAYFEDTLQVAPETVLSAGTLGAETLGTMMEASGLAGLRVREMVDTGMLQAGAVTATVPRCWLAGVRGALRN